MLPCQDSLHQPMPRFHCMRRVCQHHAIHHRQRSHHSQSSYRSQRSCHSHHNHNHHNQRSCRSQRSCHSCHNHHSQRSWSSTHHSLYASETRCGCSHVWAVIYQLLSRVVWPSHPMGSKLIKWYCWPSYPKNPWPQSQVKQLRPLTLGLMGCNVGIRLRVLSDQQKTVDTSSHLNISGVSLARMQVVVTMRRGCTHQCLPTLVHITHFNHKYCKNLKNLMFITS